LATESYSDYGSKLSQVHSLFYRPSEFFLNSKDYGTETEMWAIGCVFVETLTENLFFKEIRIFKCLLQSRMYSEQLNGMNEKKFHPPFKLKQKISLKLF
jgi:serine/threonine protein kinase